MIVTHEITLDFGLNAAKFKSKVDVKATSQNFYQLQIFLHDVDVTTIKTATVYAVRPDSTLVYTMCEIMPDCLFLPLDALILIPGTVKMEISLVTLDEIGYSATFQINVTPKLQDDSAIEAQDEFTALQIFLLQLTKALNELDNINATAYTLPEGSEATATYDKNISKFTFGIPEGKSAKINGVNTLDIIEGKNVQISQNDNKLTINATGDITEEQVNEKISKLSVITGDSNYIF